MKKLLILLSLFCHVSLYPNIFISKLTNNTQCDLCIEYPTPVNISADINPNTKKRLGHRFACDTFQANSYHSGNDGWNLRIKTKISLYLENAYIPTIGEALTLKLEYRNNNIHRDTLIFLMIRDGYLYKFYPNANGPLKVTQPVKVFDEKIKEGSSIEIEIKQISQEAFYKSSSMMYWKCNQSAFDVIFTQVK